MAKNKNNHTQNNNNYKSNQKFRLKNFTLPTPDKSADPPQPQGKNDNKEV